MPLATGEHLGPYEILAPIGAGGMGEVYRARDTRLGREVAIKISKDKFSDRFEREARSIAALNHPNICHLYDVGPNYLVMELIEGASPKGPMPLDQALDIARQIAAALDAAHERGIIHRDLKPANIKLTPDGTVKVLDFGLAKMVESDDPAPLPENSPTETLGAATQAGLILGTAAYMAPEQVRGKAVDKRADIWAFGCVLYELITGKQLFQGETVSDVLSSVLKSEPDLSTAPVEVRRLLSECLEKDSKKRLRDIGDAARLVTEPTVSLDGQRIWPWVAAAAVLGIAALFGWLRPGQNAAESFTLSLALPPGVTLGPIPPQISPDGGSVWYHTSDFRAFVRKLDSLETQPIPARAGSAPFWASDSGSLVTWSVARGLVKFRLSDGAQEPLAGVQFGSNGGSWSDSGTILFTTFPGCAALALPGGQVKPVEVPKQFSEGICPAAEFLPGGRDLFFLFAPTDDPQDAAVYIASFHDGRIVDPVLLFRSMTGAHYTPAGGGRLLFVRNDNLYSQTFRNRKLQGEPELLLQDVASTPGMTVYRADFSVARNGTVVWRPGKAVASRIMEFDRVGNEIGTSGPAGQYASLSLSPNERQLLAAGFEAAWLVDVEQPGRLDLPKGVRWMGWFAGGSKLIGIRNKTFAEVSSSGAGQVRLMGRVTNDLGVVGSPSLSFDGKELVAFTTAGTAVALLDGSADEISTKILFNTPDRTRGPMLSPDRRWLLYSAEDGICVRSVPGPGPRRQIAPPPANFPFPYWREDGKEILYFSDGDLMSIAVSWSGGTPEFAPPRKLFSGLRRAPGVTTGGRPLAASRDGSRIFWLQAIERTETNVIHVKTHAIR